MVATASVPPLSPPATVPAGHLAPWPVAELPAPPPPGWGRWLRTIVGPGLLIAGASVGAGEWLFGPAVSAQYGGTLLWLGTISIVLQLFCNLEIQRYALYCGEPAYVGFLRTSPGPRLWLTFYLLIELAALWPFNAANAAVPLAAAILGHLPGSETLLVKLLGYGLFLLAFVPLIFGGAIYRALERVMSVKLAIVLGFLVVTTVTMVSFTNVAEVMTGFFRFGTVPLRAETVIAGPHFTLTEQGVTMQGTFEKGQPIVTAFGRWKLGEEIPAELRPVRDRMVERARSLAQPNAFTIIDGDVTMQGVIRADGSWEARPAPTSERAEALVRHHGQEHVNLIAYTARNGRLPPFDWALLAAFAGIAGAGGLANLMFSSFARDKGWGMGAHVGAIPSAVGGRTIELSHVGRVFRPEGEALSRWRGWFRFIVRDQVLVWMLCSFIGLALPCMLSLEFIRHAPASGNRVAAMMADGMAQRVPGMGAVLWPMTLLVGFIVLFPGQIMASDSTSRRWTDIIWTGSGRAQRLGGHQVTYVYYGILAVYAVWGLVALTLFDPLQVGKIGGVMNNIALAACSFHVVYLNRTLLPAELRPHPLMQIGTLACGLFFLALSLIVFWQL